MNENPGQCKTALITGGTRGLGLVLASTLGDLGFRILVNYTHSGEAAARAMQLLSDRGINARPLRADVGNPTEVEHALNQIADDYGQLDVLVHNAVRFPPFPHAVRPEHMAVVLGPLVSDTAKLGSLMTPNSGRIVAISSTGAQRAIPHYQALGVAKAALESLVRYLAVEFAKFGITVNAVAPGRLSGDKRDRAGPHAKTESALIARTPAGRLTAAQDVADVVELLCHSKASWVHGQVITVDGGMSLLP